VAVPLVVELPAVICEPQRAAIQTVIPDEAVNFPETLRYWRQVRKMTQKQLGARMGRDSCRFRVHRWERLRRSPEIKGIVIVAHALGIPAAWLFTPWPIDETSREILQEVSGLPAKTRWELMGELRDMVAGRI
jgi:transcriptional regulator with XRE-family HTH domain